VRLCDSHRPGARGSQYVSWLPAEQSRTAPAAADYPDNNASSTARPSVVPCAPAGRLYRTNTASACRFADKPDNARAVNRRAHVNSACQW